MSKEQLDVKDFITEALGLTLPQQPSLLELEDFEFRRDCMREELDEMDKAYTNMRLDEIGDALVDLVYFAHGTALHMGLPWDQMWDEVHSANMKKKLGQTKRGFALDASKPREWKAPDHTKFIGRGPWPIRKIA